MKLIMPILLIGLSAGVYGQCKTVYGNRAACPTFKDSFELYQNTLEVLRFYEQNPAYKKVRSVAINSERSRADVFDRLQNARRLFHVVRQDQNKNKLDSTTKKPTDTYFDSYFKYINENRFSQRELENQIINLKSPFPLYDNRISPLVVNEYKCINENDEYFGDLVNIPLYVPLIVKPVKLLSQKEKETRAEMIRKIEEDDVANIFEDLHDASEIANTTLSKETEKKEKSATTSETVIGKESNNRVSVRTSIPEEIEKEKNTDQQTESSKPIKPAFVFDDRYANPVYYYNQYGSGSIIGFSIKQYFRKLKPEEYDEYMLPKSTRDFLSNEESMMRWLRSKYGNYYTFFL